MIQFEQVYFSYENKIIFEETNFLAKKGEIHIIIGLNGAGKSTFFRLIAGILRADKGSILLDSNDIQKLDSKSIAALVGLCHTSQPKTELKVFEMLQFSGLDDIKIDNILEKGKLIEYKYRSLNFLSDGQLQWLFILRAFGMDRPIILLDEPTSFLDRPHRIWLQKLIQLNAHEGKTILINTHDSELISIENAIKWELGNKTIQLIQK